MGVRGTQAMREWSVPTNRPAGSTTSGYPFVHLPADLDWPPSAGLATEAAGLSASPKERSASQLVSN